MKHKLSVEGLAIRYKIGNTALTAIKDFNLTAKENEFVCLLGPTGCGKTTILNAIAGFIKPLKGEICLNSKIITKPTKDIGIVFQHNALFPWKTAKENIIAGPKINHISKDESDRLSHYYLKLIDLEKHANHYPEELSGGQQQRVAIARTLAANPQIILMDEPFGALDAQTRAKMHETLLNIWQRHRKTIIFVTHDIDEALLLSDRILIMTKNPGRIKKEIKNILPRPRDYKLTTKKEFISQKEEIMGFLE